MFHWRKGLFVLLVGVFSLAGAGLAPAHAQTGSVEVVAIDWANSICSLTGLTVKITWSWSGTDVSWTYDEKINGAGPGEKGLNPSFMDNPASWWWDPFTTPAYPYTFELTVRVKDGATVLDSATVTGTCLGLDQFAVPVAPPGELIFQGPPLPAPDKRNLVLITGDIGVQDVPDGEPTGRVLRRCQTAFVIDTSEDGLWYKLFVMGGWIPVNATRDVAETYGQPGGEAIDIFCQ